MTPTLRRLLWPGIMSTVMLLVLLGLGTWQVYRLHWKEGILAEIARAEASPPIPLTPQATSYQKVAVQGRFLTTLSAEYGAQVKDTAAGPTMGAQLLVPLQRDGGGVVLVDRGWVPDTRRRPLDQPDGEVRITGYLRPSESPGWFSAPDDVPGRHFFTLNPAAIGAVLGLQQVAPFTLVALGAPPQGGLPIPAEHLPRPPNNHLSYAITWYGLALALVVVFGVWVRQGQRRGG